MERMTLLRRFVLGLMGMILFAASPARAAEGAIEVVHLDFDNDSPGQPPLTGGPGQPTSLTSQPGTSIIVQPSANGIDTQPVVLTAQGASQFAGVITLFEPVSEGVVRVEATVAFDRLADGFFLQTTAGSGAFPLAVVTRLIIRDSGEIQDNKTRTPVGTYAPSQPFRVRMDIDMSANTWSVVVDDQLDGFDDDPVVSNLPFENAVAVLPTVGQVWATLNLFPTLSVAPTAVAYDDIRVLVPAGTAEVGVDIKPGDPGNHINPRGHGLIRVAIMSSVDFDATTVDPSSVRFGPNGASEDGGKTRFKDVNGDGLDDLILRFRIKETGIRCGDRSASLTGETFGGQLFHGADSIRTRGCRER